MLITERETLWTGQQQLVVKTSRRNVLDTRVNKLLDLNC
jgi:hypothetical protein